LVAVLPVLAVYALHAIGRLQSPVMSIALAIAISLAATRGCSIYWARRPGSSDIVFGDLMVWGWLRRLRTERRLARATRLLELDGRQRRSGGEELSRKRQAEVLEELAAALEARDPYTQGHTRRVTRHSHMIARQMGLPSEQAARIRAAAAVHDVGKMRVPREILNKPGRLTDEEFRVMKGHAPEGAAMISRLGDPEISAMVRHHHEQLDGSGYPDGLRGGDIPLGARIIAVADTFDAMTSSRPYRSARRHREAIEVLKESAGSQLDPGAVRAFLSYYSGKSGIAWSGFLAGVPERVLSWLWGVFQGAGAAAGAKGAAIVGATALLTGSMGHVPPEKHRSGTRSPRAATVIAAVGYHGDTRLALPVSRQSSSGRSRAKRGAASAPAEDSGSGRSGTSAPTTPGPNSGSGDSRPASDPGPSSGTDPGSSPGSDPDPERRSLPKPVSGDLPADTGVDPAPRKDLPLPDVPDLLPGSGSDPRTNLPLPDVPLANLPGTSLKPRL
jgi:hypothetical protein